jgi:hypothetical protein
MAVPDSSPRASARVSIRDSQMLTFTDGTLFPPGCRAILWGHASGPAGLAPEALEEYVYSFKVFFAALSSCEASVSASLGDVSAGLSGAIRMCLTFMCVWCISRRCSLASSPRAWARSRRSGWALRLISTPPRHPSAGQRVRCPQLPTSGSRIAGSSLSCYRVIQVDAHAPFDKGWLVVRRLVHGSAYVGVLGRARSRSLGTEGAEALPRWDPLTSCPRWLLNMTCGAPSSWRA